MQKKHGNCKIIDFIYYFSNLNYLNNKKPIDTQLNIFYICIRTQLYIYVLTKKFRFGKKVKNISKRLYIYITTFDVTI